MKDDVTLKTEGDNDFYLLEQISFKIVLQYRGNNDIQSTDLWESFIGISPKNYGTPYSIVYQFQQRGIPPVVALDMNQYNEEIGKS